MLVAAAVILIPELLSGPSARVGSEAAIEDDQVARPGTPTKTYTIDLNRPPGSQSLETNIDDARASASGNAESGVTPAPAEPQSPASVQEAPTAAAERMPSDTAPRPATAQASPAVTPPRPASASAATGAASTRPSTPPPAAPPAPAPTQPAPAAASRPAGPTASGWAVQVGSFSKQDTAEQLAKELRGQGHATFVMPVRSGATTLYRVRIGPVKERASAEALLRKVRQERASLRDATVVSHP